MFFFFFFIQVGKLKNHEVTAVGWWIWDPFVPYEDRTMTKSLLLGTNRGSIFEAEPSPASSTPDLNCKQVL